MLDNPAAGKVVNQITVKDQVNKGATVALDRMLMLTGSGTLSKPHINSEAVVD